MSDNKTKHVHAIAEYMYEHAPEYGLDPDEMYVLGMLHDIGYIRGKTGHSENGADLLKQMGINERFTYAILKHGADLRKIKVTPELLLLVTADLQIDYEGEFIGYEARVAGVRLRYGEDSIQYKRVAGTVEYLEEHGLKGE